MGFHQNFKSDHQFIKNSSQDNLIHYSGVKSNYFGEGLTILLKSCLQE